MKQDRFLIAILIGIGLLAALAVGVYFVRHRAATYGPEDSPAGVVHNYIVALSKQDYTRGYTYLAAGENRPNLEQFRQPFVTYQAAQIASTSLEIGETTQSVDDASVQVIMIHSPSGPFTQLNRDVQAAVLVRESGAWKLRSMPFPFWSYDWFTPTPAVK